ncbi:hypothetical protein LHYA1_G006474 [Lachnellula hyalina]|uniref:Gag1-like clamp domain-containing protein n=1 Tax=Lachnellula hyalina TaxID=1316788 RepID=A0A8H8QYE1_9HELO|nr:uncharacterized protein LHYA1_G006474 [Lachnellula hyalina]TVY25138.1 hypothetical protein LHYA1_G006474 [Lachnellula hyalina]
MPQALPAAKPGNAGGSPIGTASRGSCHELMQNAQAGHPQDAEPMSVMSNGEGQPALDAPALNLALPEEHHALQHQQQRQQRSDSSTLSANIISRNAASDDDRGVRATLTATKSDLLDDAAVVEHSSYNHGQAPPPQGESIVPRTSRDASPPNVSTTSLKEYSIPAQDHPQPIPSTTSQTIPSRRKVSGRTTAAKNISHEGKMHFGGNSGPGSVAYRRRAMANTSAITIYEADLASEDRAKQKEAIRKYLGEVVKEDWEWEWPPPISAQNSTTESELHHSELENPVGLEWRERDEWLSGGSDSEPEATMPGLKSSKSPKSPKSPGSPKSPFRFDNPDDVGDSIRKMGQERKRRRKKRLREEMEANDGMRCFTERRDAWTGARHVPAITHTLPVPKRQSQSSGDGSSTAVDLEETDDDYEDDDTEIPIAPPILPPTNDMRKSITPDAYNTIYDKVILQSLTPSCPMNLKDVTRSCVQGWKRDGEWPPKSVPESPGTRRRRMSVADLFSSGKRQTTPKQPAKENENEGDKKEEKTHTAGPFKKFKHKIMTMRRGSTADKDGNGEGGAAPAA